MCPAHYCSGIHALPKKVVIEVKEGNRAAALKVPMTYAFTQEKISLSFSF